MKGVVEFLKSRGKLGAVGLILLGLGLAVHSFISGEGQYQEPLTIFFLGVTLLGIRGKQDK